MVFSGDRGPLPLNKIGPPGLVMVWITQVSKRTKPLPGYSFPPGKKNYQNFAPPRHISSNHNVHFFLILNRNLANKTNLILKYESAGLGNT